MTAEHVAETVSMPSTATTEEIAVLPPTPEVTPDAPMNPRTGEPRRPWSIRMATGASMLAVVGSAAGLLGVYWNATIDFSRASWLSAQFHSPSVLTELLVIAAITAIGLLVAVSNAITGYYAWCGYRWTRIAGLISAGLSLLMLMLIRLGWPTIPLTIIAAALLWLPPSAGYYRTWARHRQPERQFAEPTTEVFYGPLPRYRR